MKKLILFLALLLFIPSIVLAQTSFSNAPGMSTTEEDGSPDVQCITYKFANGNVTDNGDGTCSVADATGGHGDGANCTAGQAPLGVDASGAVQSCFDVWTEAENTAAAYISAETNTLETTVTGPQDTEIFIGNGTDSGTWTVLSGDATLANNGTVTVASALTRDTEWDTFAEINAASTDTDAVLDTDIGSTVQAWDAELDTIAALTETNGAVMFVAGGVWTADTTPAIDCTDCTNVGGAETNTLETTVTGVLSNEIFIGNGTDSGVWVTLSGDATNSGGVITVVDDSHAHTTTTVSGLDVSDDLNLTAGRSLTLTGDDVLADAELYTDSKGVWIDNPVVESLNELIIFMSAATITRIHCYTDVGTATLNLENASDADVLSADIVCDVGGQSACASGCDVNTINLANDNFAAFAEGDIDISATASTPGKVSVFIGYELDD